MSDVWPRRKRSTADDAMLTIAGCSTYLQRQRGRENGFYDPAEPLAREGAYESLSQLRDREAARTLRLQWGVASFEAVVRAYADEIEQTLRADNMTEQKGAV